ncbi:MAG: response regulator [Hyphomonadaceae bacterium]|nr:response regulator [Hyphomonadaceae bacterium]
MASILIVEDEIFTRELAGMLIEDLGHSVLFAGSVDEALVLLRSDQPIDALFTDIYLKTAVFGGCDLARIAVSLRPNLRVLYTTGNATTAELRATFVVGSHFLGKPYSPDQLQTSVHGMLAA